MRGSREGNRRKMHFNQRQCRIISEPDEQRSPSRLKHIVLLEKKYSELLKSRGSLDPAVRGARVSLRDNYEELILSSNSSIYAADVEQALWRLHYRGIEEFRTKIRNLSPSSSGRGNKKNGHQESLSRVVNSFTGFLDETSGYFHRLIVKLRAKYGLPPSPSPGEGLMFMNSEDGLCHCAVSCHRLFIYLGDLARYRELCAVQDPNKRDWTIAANYYRQAAGLCPSSGNTYNQLAVLATYIGDALSAIYYYCRSLAVDAPFITARENLILLFEKKRHHVCKVPLVVEGSGQLSYLIAAAEREGEKARGSSPLSCHKGNPQVIVEGESNVVAIKEIWECFQNHFIQLAATIFTKSCIEELEDAVSKSKSALEQLFHHCSTDLETAFPSKMLYQGGSGIIGQMRTLEIVIILIVLIHDAHEQFQNIATTSENLHVFILFRFCLLVVSLLINKASKSDEGKVNFLLPGVLVFMEWVACQSSFLKDIKVNAAVAKELSGLRHETELLCKMFLKQKTCLDTGMVNAVTDMTLRGTSQAALWEDYELLGFSPLASSQQKLDFSSLCTTKDGIGILQARLQRLMCSLKAFDNFLGYGVVHTHSGDSHEEIECDPEGIAISVEHVCNLKGTTVILDGNPTTSLKDWIQPSKENSLATDFSSVSDHEKSNNVDEDSSCVHFAVVKESEGSKIDGLASLEPKSSEQLPENSKKDAGSGSVPKDSFFDITNHPPSSVRWPQNDKQPSKPWNLTQECSLQNRQESAEIPQGASFSNNNIKSPVAVYHGTQVSDDERTSVPENCVSDTSDNPPSLVGCPQDGKQSNIHNLTKECFLQTRQDPVRRLQGLAFSNNDTIDAVAFCHNTKFCEGESKTSLSIPKFASKNNNVSQKSLDATEASSSQLFSRGKVQLVEDLKWLDDYTHVKPAVLKLSYRGLDNDFLMLNSGNKRKRAGDHTFEMILNTRDMKQYQSQNPFVKRLNGQTHKPHLND